MGPFAHDFSSTDTAPAGASPPVGAAFFGATEAGARFDVEQVRRAQAAMPAQAAALVQLALAYAASAEQRLAEQAARIQELENLSITDPLTGLLNRRGFNTALERCLANAQRHGEQGLLAYLDLDGFKAVNDRLGHTAGDAALVHTAELLRREVRATDYVARLGGDEFAILFTRADRAAARTIAQKLKGCLSGEAALFAGQRIALYASIGITRYDQASAADALLAAADRAMYRDKAKSQEKAKRAA